MKKIIFLLSFFTCFSCFSAPVSLATFFSELKTPPKPAPYRCPTITSEDLVQGGRCVNIQDPKTEKNPHWIYMHLDPSTYDPSRPTVIFEAGLGDWSTAWDSVRLELAKEQILDQINLITYDRSNYGKSPIYPTPINTGRTAQMTIDDLRRALSLVHTGPDASSPVGIKPPYILAGHSMGGVYIRLFAREYPQEVSGLLFVDPAVPEHLDYLNLITAPPIQGFGVATSDYRYAEGTSLQLSLLQLFYAPPYPDNIIPDSQGHLKTEFGNLPLTVITAGQPHCEGFTQEQCDRWDAAEKILSQQSTNGKQVIATDCPHDIELCESGIPIITQELGKLVTQVGH